MSAETKIAPGQVWAHRDDRYDGWRYLTVLDVKARYVHAHNRKRRTRILADRFGRGTRWMFCGYDGPGVLPAFSTRPVSGGCWPCPSKPAVLPLERLCAVGFGCVSVTRDGETVWAGDSEKKRLAHFELRARETPGDWRIRFSSPMSELLYQRQGDSNWVLVFRGMGFA
jgi:hypothetical protein